MRTILRVSSRLLDVPTFIVEDYSDELHLHGDDSDLYEASGFYKDVLLPSGRFDTIVGWDMVRGHRVWNVCLGNTPDSVNTMADIHLLLGE